MAFGNRRYGATVTAADRETVKSTGRYREVFEVDMVAHLWAHRTQSTARNGGRDNFYFRGDTIYSYGEHFPIARHVTGTRGRAGVLFTTRTYSNTTNKHIWAVRGALRGLDLPTFNVEYPGVTEHGHNLEDYAKRFTAALELAAKARGKAEEHRGTAERVAAEARAYADFFGVRWSKALAAKFAISDKLMGELADKVKAQRQAAKAAAAERERKAAERIRVNREVFLPAWLAGARQVEHNGQLLSVTNYTLGDLGGLDYLRVKPGEPDTVETTRGATVPLDHVRRAWPVLAALRAAGKGYRANGHTIHVGAFAIDEMEADTGLIRAGCHRIAWSEAERFAKSQGWA